MAQKPKIQIKGDNFGLSDTSFKYVISFINTGGVGDDVIDPTNYRLVFNVAINGDPSIMSTTVQTGFDRIGGLPQGGLNFSTPNQLPYDTQVNPPHITAGKVFNCTYRCRFSKESALGNFGSGQGCENLSIEFRRSDNKQFSKEDGNTGPNFSYQNNWSAESITGTYAILPGVLLEFNDIDPGVANSTNWSRADIYSDEFTIAAVQPTYPYPALDTSASTHFNTFSDHRWLVVTKENWIDDVNPTTNHGGDNILEVYNSFWDGSANSTRRSMLEFNTSSLPVGSTVLDGAVIVTCTGTIDHSASTDIALTNFTDAWVENTANWNSANTGFGVNLNIWETYANAASQKDSIMAYRVTPAQITQIFSNGCGIKHNIEAPASGKRVNFFGSSNFVGVDIQEPILLVRFSPSISTSTLKQISVW